MSYKLITKDGSAKRGEFTTPHGVIQTPVFMNVGTAAAIADAVIEGKPLISRVTTVTGCVKEPTNLLLRIGTSVADAVEACGG